MKAMEANHYTRQMKTMKATMTMLATKAMEAMSRKQAMLAMKALQAIEAKKKTRRTREEGENRMALLTLMAPLSLNGPLRGWTGLPPRPAAGLQRPPSWSSGWQ